MPRLISIAVESAHNVYLALDTDGQLWRGRIAAKGVAIRWERVTSEFLADTGNPPKKV